MIYIYVTFGLIYFSQRIILIEIYILYHDLIVAVRKETARITIECKKSTLCKKADDIYAERLDTFLIWSWFFGPPEKNKKVISIALSQNLHARFNDESVNVESRDRAAKLTAERMHEYTRVLVHIMHTCMRN